eukprot:366318-Chlamydomonas_euryale.AAC.10
MSAHEHKLISAPHHSQQPLQTSAPACSLLRPSRTACRAASPDLGAAASWGSGAACSTDARRATPGACCWLFVFASDAAACWALSRICSFVDKLTRRPPGGPGGARERSRDLSCSETTGRGCSCGCRCCLACCSGCGWCGPFSRSLPLRGLAPWGWGWLAGNLSAPEATAWYVRCACWMACTARAQRGSQPCRPLPGEHAWHEWPQLQAHLQDLVPRLGAGHIEVPPELRVADLQQQAAICRHRSKQDNHGRHTPGKGRRHLLEAP